MVQEAQITSLRLPNGETVALVDWTDRPLYSTIDLLSGFTDQQIEAFTYVQSDRVSNSSNITVRRTATLADTNISTPAGMSSSEEMLVYGIKVEPIQLRTITLTASQFTDSTAATDFYLGYPLADPGNLGRLARRCILDLVVAQKTYAQAGLAYFSTGFGVVYQGSQFQTTTLNAGRSFGSFGVQSAEASRAFAIPTHIGGSEKYKVVLNNPLGSAVQFFLADGVPNSITVTTSTPDLNVLIQLRIHLEGLYKRPVG